MCRWAAYHGPEVYLEDIVTAPCHSLIAQSHQALEAKTPTNGDGFGIAWYGSRGEPGLYRDILPAWSDPNLKSLCRQIRASLFLAHVRAATGGGTSRANCHPFASGRWSFMHNGQIGDFERIRRPLESRLSDEGFAQRLGNTDSELIFLMMMEAGLTKDPAGAIRTVIDTIEATAREAGIEPALKLTAALSDGHTLFATRYATDGHAPTLYMASMSNGGRCLVSEPFDRAAPIWTPIPQDSFVAIDRDGVSLSPLTRIEPPLALAS